MSERPAAVKMDEEPMAIKIDGKAVADQIRADIKLHIERIQVEKPTYLPSLVILQVGGRPDSSTYVRMKAKAATESGISCVIENLDESTTEAAVVDRIKTLNADPAVHGILVQLPLPTHMSERTVTEAVALQKDVDGFGSENIGELAKRNGAPMFVPCTPKGVMKLLEWTGTQVAGKHAVVVGRSNIVGRPVSYLLQAADATVTLCHSKTVHLETHLKMADIVVAAVGVPGLIRGEWLKKGAVVIDVGTNYVEDSSRKSGFRMVGDVDAPSARPVAAYLTPVPGGVGPMTVAMLMQNVVDAADRCT